MSYALLPLSAHACGYELDARAPAEAFAFYERLGFARVDDDTATHRLMHIPEERSS